MTVPAWLLEFVMKHGSELNGLSRNAIAVRYGLSEFRARAVYTYLKTIASLEAALAPPSPRPRTHLVIGDAHARPDQCLVRFSRLGRMCNVLRPDVVVCIGDWADMPSLSSYDKGKRSFEGRRYVKDIDSANVALDLFHRELSPDYKPELVFIVGNHEHRIHRACNDASEFDGLIGLDDLDFAARGWKVIPFLQPHCIDGVTYSHYFTSRNTPSAVSGEYAAAALVRQKMTSCVAGHSHMLDYARRADVNGNAIHGLHVGCYTDAFEDYAGPSNNIWWRGIAVLRNVRDGDYDLELWSLDRINAEFTAGLQE